MTRRTVVLDVLTVAAVFGMLAFLNGRADSNHLRWIASGLVIALAAALIWQSPTSLWRTPVIAIGAAAALVMVLLTSPDLNIQVFEAFMTYALAGAIGWTIAWLFIRIAVVRANAKHQALPVLLLSGAISFALLVVSAGAWLTAVDLNVMGKNPVVTTGAELKAAWETPWGQRHSGIFAVGVVGDPAMRDDTPGASADPIAYYGARTHSIRTSTAPTWLPLSYDLRLADGEVASVQGVSEIIKTANWPECGDRLWQRCLRQGDPVVIWADPGELVAMGTGVRSGALNATRVIAYGSLDDFMSGYLARAVFTARIFGWIALAFIPLSLIPLGVGILRFRWLRRHGSDRAPLERTRPAG